MVKAPWASGVWESKVWWRGGGRGGGGGADAPYLIERAAARCVEADTGSHALPTYQMPPVTNSSRRPTSFQTNPPHSTHSLLLHPRSGRSQIPSPSHTVLSPYPNATRIEAKKKGGTWWPFLFLFPLFFSPFTLSPFISVPPIHPSITRPAHRPTYDDRPPHSSIGSAFTAFN